MRNCKTVTHERARGGKNYGQKDVVVDNAKLFVSNRQLLGIKSPGSHNTKTRTNTKTGNNEDTAANNGSDDTDGRSFGYLRGYFQL